MTTIPRMIVLRRQDSPEHDPQDDLTPTSGQFSARYPSDPGRQPAREESGDRYAT